MGLTVVVFVTQTYFLSTNLSTFCMLITRTLYVQNVRKTFCSDSFSVSAAQVVQLGLIHVFKAFSTV
jgi:hypothetical protein